MIIDNQCLKKRLANLEIENQHLKQQVLEADHMRSVWEKSVVQLEQTQKALLQTQNQLKKRLNQLPDTKMCIQKLAYSDQQVIEHMQEALMVTDAAGHIIQVNPAFSKTTGYARDEVMNKTPGFLRSGRHNKQFYRAMRDSLRENGHWQGEVWSRRKNGGVCAELLSITAVKNSQHETINYISVFYDLTERKKMEDDLKKLSRAVEHSPLMVIITNQNGIIEYVNPRFSEISGYSADEIIGKHSKILQSGQTEKSLYKDLWRTIKSGKNWRGEFRNRKKNGELYWQQVSISPIFDDNHIITNFVAIEEDITQRKITEEKIWHQANFDVLTGLPNRRLLNDRLQQFISHAIRYKHQGALMFIDLDHFKKVNDTFGHNVGDLLLKEVAMRITSCTRESDTVARLSGDEFTVILPEALTSAAVTHVAKEILQQLSSPFVINDRHLCISASIGISLFPQDGTSLHQILKNADTAMYQSKKAGKNVLRFFNSNVGS